jgi:pimeloyl-ACP methyl ester carboxylesterase
MTSEKRTIVFIHYFGGDSGSWKWLDKHLDHNYDSVYLDLPGFNGTEALEELSIRKFAEWIKAQIEGRDLKRYVLCGHSMGAKLALFTAFLMKTNPPEKIILIAPSPPTVENMPAHEKKRMLHHPDEDEAIITVENATCKSLKPKKFDYAVQSQLRIEQKTWGWWIKEGMGTDVSWATKNLDIPTFVICSTSDPVIGMDDIHEEVLPHIQNARLSTFGKSGHLIPMESSRKLAKRINRIMRK